MVISTLHEMTALSRERGCFLTPLFRIQYTGVHYKNIVRVAVFHGATLFESPTSVCFDVPVSISP